MFDVPEAFTLAELVKVKINVPAIANGQRGKRVLLFRSFIAQTAPKASIAERGKINRVAGASTGLLQKLHNTKQYIKATDPEKTTRRRVSRETASLRFSRKQTAIHSAINPPTPKIESNMLFVESRLISKR